MITNINVDQSKDKDFPEVLVAPFSDSTVTLKNPAWNSFEVAYIDDFGGLKFNKYQCAQHSLANYCHRRNKNTNVGTY
ncbi:hypothetical protein J4727_02020 [Providencia rettgeri]|uniref:Pili assembly chaperone C-terminal domain-containing protein n=1 Tax=Providencia rettgeri TaxID=587 RepID=A0A939NA11_PRORE|nr:hypothetical protein [Providencia rettgeri]